MNIKTDRKKRVRETAGKKKTEQNDPLYSTSTYELNITPARFGSPRSMDPRLEVVNVLCFKGRH